MNPGGHRVRRAVALGGGHGLSRSLAALRQVADEVVAIVSVADDGGSSGRLRRDLDVVPPGDLRMALAALGQRERLASVLGYRFPRGELGGHALGNLVLVALQDLHDGDLVAALDELALHLGVSGRVLPCTTEAVTLEARSASGGISGQAAIAATTRLERVWLEPAAPAATPAALDAVAAADLLVLGPGSLYTSLLPNLLVPELAAAVAGAVAPRVLVANLREQPGETEGMNLTAHLDALSEHVPEVRIDAMVVHAGRPSPGPGQPLQEGACALEERVARVIRADLLKPDEGREDGHDPAALAAAFARLV